MDQHSIGNKSDLVRELRKLELFANLNAEQLGEIANIVDTQTCSRGEAIITEGEQGSSLYVVLSGSFDIRLDKKDKTLARIGAGQPIGEIGFIAGNNRTASVVAVRESIVLVLDKERFDVVCEQNPTIWHAISVALAKRVLVSNQSDDKPVKAIANTIAIIAAGPNKIPHQFVDKFILSLGEADRILKLDSDNILKFLPNGAKSSDVELARALNGLETEYDHIVYLSDRELTDWSAVAIKQADLVICVGEHNHHQSWVVQLNNVEKFAQTLHDQQCQRLVLLHSNKDTITGTSNWLTQRNIAMHHHVCIDDMGDYQRLVRFIRGTAIGMAACGGGALCCAHLGIYEAFSQAGISFDILGGTSGGSAMMAAFATGNKADDVQRQTIEMFVTQKALGHYNIPIYSLLDHLYLDNQLKKAFGNGNIEDCWIPFFAVATDLSNGGPICIRTGKIWQAVRASAALPALLPPFFTDKGEMLVDGGLVENVPIGTMRELKDGPNIVISFEESHREYFAVDYDKIPSRFALMSAVASRKGRERLRNIPFLTNSLIRALLANRQDFRTRMGEDDILMIPQLPQDVGLMDWHQCSLLMNCARQWASAEICRLRENSNPVLKLIEDI